MKTEEDKRDRSVISTSKKHKVAIVGNPNVGKSMLFNRLTGAYVAVSNYPGTTVEVSKGNGRIEGNVMEIIDTPGMYSFMPITEEERVARSIILNEKPDVILHVVDAKNIERGLSLTLQIVETGIPTILVLNIMDEAEKLGFEIDTGKLEEILKIPVLPTVSTTGKGITELKRRILEHIDGDQMRVDYGESVESALSNIGQSLNGSYGLSKRALGLLLLQRDHEAEELISESDGDVLLEALEEVRKCKMAHEHSLDYLITMKRQDRVKEIISTSVRFPREGKTSRADVLSNLMMSPLTGIPILAIVLYYGLYQFVGVFGAGTLVDFLEGVVFERYVNPLAGRIFGFILPWEILQSLFIGEYGIITLGIRYAVAIILPIVGTFFLAFSIMEDSGYFPRLAMLVDKVFKKIGLNGRAVIPMALGFGCDTMATIVTRILETKRERVIATFLLALAIPCSAQMGVIIGLLSQKPGALLIWGSFVTIEFLIVGFLISKVISGEEPSFYMEVPPLRLPNFSNVFTKTYARMGWYLKEVFPLFIYASLIIWAGYVTGLFQLAIKGVEPLVRFIGLPDSAAVAFLFGFFRRDYGAAGLYDLNKGGALSGVQLVVAAITLTLFLPCIAQFLVMRKERGLKTTLAISVFIFPTAFLSGFLANLILTGLGIEL